MAGFLLELRCEEIPARMQAGARAELEKLFRRELAAAGIALDDLRVWSTPRRLALIARELPSATEALSEEAKGPPEGAPDAAIDGFCKKAGVTRDQLTLREVKGRMTWFAVVDTPGRAMAEVLAEAIPAIIRDFSWPKSMRWGAPSISTDSIRWVRPLSGIVALLDGEVVAVEVGGIVSGRDTMGHRFHHSGPVAIGSADSYASQLRDAHVIVDHEEREAMVRDGAARAAAEAGLALVPDEGLVIENAGLTEWPVPLLGQFDPAFLEVPPEVIQLTARVNQKYFICHDAEGRLAPAFVCTANIAARDGGAAIVAGNRKVLAARLSDARFFWEQDRRRTLAAHAEGLARITFHEKLGTVADKAERVAKLARWLVQEGIVKPASLERRGLGEGAAKAAPAVGVPLFPTLSPEGEREQLADLAEQAALLCKADLVTGMVGEFPELQGLMGGYYARAEGLPDAVADAIRDHYKPVGQGDDVPTAPVTVAVALADKLDNVRSFFTIDEKPTGSKDPFALRRAALGIIRLVLDNGLRMPFARDEVLEFFADRLKVQQREAGVRHDLIDAVFGLGEDDLVRLLARVHALQAFMATADGADLLAAYKRAANILKAAPPAPGEMPEPVMAGPGEQGIAQTGEEDPLVMVDDPDLADAVAAFHAREDERQAAARHPAEAALAAALDAAEPRAAEAVAAEHFAGAMAALASLRAPIDGFFEGVMVNDPDADVRAHRLGLLARFRDAVHRVADFSRIEG